VQRKAVILLTGLTVLVGAVFALWPGLDLAAAAAFHGASGFPAGDPALKLLRALLFYLPVAVLAGFVVAWGLGRLGVALPAWARPAGRSVLYLALGMALGPGLLVNVALKDHWHRPRPVQVTDFGGSLDFRPWYRTDGACAANCSFVSGETASAFWLVAPASLAPPPLRGPAIAAALLAGVATATLRMAFGGHFLSDVLFAALFTLLLLAGLARLVLGRGGGEEQA
jgi:membrane-associated phospholipid phosphatase